ncbi:MAG: ATP-dependent DNA helicase RecG, partial [Prevotella sp.]|nr:ATP-dependent DNA helicase RecG [Prevotella sp.]
MNILDQDIKYLPGMGPRRTELLNKELGIATWGDLLEHFPYKYVDRSRIYRSSELQADMPFVQLRGKILSFEEFAMGPRKKRVVAHFSDGHGVVDLVWFNGAKYVYKQYKVGVEYIVFGKPGIFNGRFQFTHPDIDPAAELELSEMGMQPYYMTTE